MALGRIKTPTVEEIVTNTKEAYQHTRQQRIIEKILAPRAIGSFAEFYRLQTSLPDGIAYVIQTQIESYDFNLSILIGGMGHTRGHLYVIDNPGTSACWDSIGFVAIGSGQYLAMHQLIGSECHDGLELAEVLIHVFDAKEAATRAPGVGKMGDIAIITKECTYAIPTVKLGELHGISEMKREKKPDWLQASRDFVRSLQKERVTLLREQFEQQYPLEDLPHDPSCEKNDDGNSA